MAPAAGWGHKAYAAAGKRVWVNIDPQSGAAHSPAQALPPTPAAPPFPRAPAPPPPVESHEGDIFLSDRVSALSVEIARAGVASFPRACNFGQKGTFFIQDNYMYRVVCGWLRRRRGPRDLAPHFD